jgi:RNA polymerase sigma-70 factor (ECF subfamily)
MNPLSHITSRFGLRRRLETARPRLYRLAWSWSHDEHVAQDLVQSTLLRALQNLDELRDPERLEVWLTSILANLFRDRLRHARDDAPIAESDLISEEDPEHFAQRSDLIENVRAGIRQLSDDQRMVLTLVDLMEFTYTDVAKALDIPTGTVMSRLCRARRNLKILLESPNRHEERPSKLRRIK